MDRSSPLTAEQLAAEDVEAAERAKKAAAFWAAFRASEEEKGKGDMSMFDDFFSSEISSPWTASVLRYVYETVEGDPSDATRIVYASRHETQTEAQTAAELALSSFIGDNTQVAMGWGRPEDYIIAIERDDDNEGKQ